MGLRGDLRLAIVFGLLLLGMRTTIAVEQGHQATKSATVAAAPNGAGSSAYLAWKTQVYARIDQSKTYPSSAEAKGEGGTVILTFSLDRQGRLTASRIVRSSGSATLDKEALDTLQRAQPFPSPPTEVAVPVRLSIPMRYVPPAVAIWQGQVFGKLQQNFHYPAAAKANGEHGTVYLAFRIDPQGRLTAIRITRSSGSATLDKDALDLFRRAQPFPPPPPAGGAQTDIPFRVNYQPCSLLGSLLRRCSG
jgi:TonB family protein